MVKPRPPFDASYGIPNPLNINAPYPVVTKRDPLGTDTSYVIGQFWINRLTNEIWALTAFSSGSAIWTSFQSTNKYPITPYVVGPIGQAGYQTIQSAVDAAVAAGGVSAAVFVQPGTYTENLNLTGATAFTVGLTIVGATALGDEGQCEIVGVHTPPTTGAFIFRNFKLSSTTNIFLSAAVGSSHLVIIDALLNVTNGYTFNCPNWGSSGIFELFDINNSGTNDGGINNTGGATVFMFSAGLGNGTVNTMVLSGVVVAQESGFGCPVNHVTGSNFSYDFCIFSNLVTCSNNSTGYFSGCHFGPTATASLTMSSSGAVAIYQSIINSSNNPCISGAGAGTLTLGGNTYISNAALAGTLTVAYATADDTGTLYAQNISFDRGATSLTTDGQLIIGDTGSVPKIATLTAGSGITITNGAGAITISSVGADLLAYTAVTNAMSSYTVLTTDEFLGVNTSAGTVTLLFPNAPSTGRVFYIKDSTGTSGTNAITVTTVGGVVNIDGSTSYTINVNYESIQILFDGSAYQVF